MSIKKLNIGKIPKNVTFCLKDNNLNIQDETELLNRTQSFKSSSGDELKPSLEMDSMPINTHFGMFKMSL